MTSENVAAYLGMVDAHAARFARLPFMQNDHDDFVQEGQIAVWLALEAGEHPSNLVVTNRMRDWARRRNRQLGCQSPIGEWQPHASLEEFLDGEELAA